MVKTKWADFVVTKQHKDSTNKRIEKLRISEDDGSPTLLNPKILTRDEIVKLITKGKTVITAPPSDKDKSKYKKGQLIHIVTVNGVKYLRTDGNNLASDNLGDLPEF